MLSSKVSVVIPAYNSEKFVAEAVESVLQQSYDNIECIVVNDGSTDNTADVVRHFGERVILVNQENRKLPGARNTGIRHASGDYISFLDADDRIAPYKVEHQLSYLQSHPEYGAVYSRVRYFRDDAPGDFYLLRRPTPEGDILNRLVLGNFIPVHSTLFRKDLVDALEGFRPFPALEDWDFLLRLSVKGCKFGFLDEISADYRMHAGGMSGDNRLMYDAKLQVIRDIASSSASILSAQGIDPEVIVNYHLADLGKNLILQGKAAEGVTAIFEASKKEIPKKIQFLLFAVAARMVGASVLKSINDITLRKRKQSKLVS